jgi:uncharacterized protein (TIGR03437 family)
MRSIALAFFLACIACRAVVFVQGTPLPSGRLGEPYNATVDIYTDDRPSLSVSIVGGNLTPGLTLSSSGVISGTPTAAGDFNFTVRAIDSSGSSTGSKLLRIVNTQLFPVSATFVYAFLGTPVNLQVEVSGAEGPILVSRESGELPPGLNLSLSGRITGTPTALGNFSARLNVSDSGGRQVSFAQGFRVIEAALRIGNLSPPRAVVAIPYSFRLTATGGNTGSQPTFFARVSGELPPGLTHENDGRISGIPSTAGIYTAVWTAEDFSGRSPETPVTISVALTNFTLSGSPPSGRTTQAYSFQFVASNGTSPVNYSLQSGQLPPGLALGALSGLLSGTPSTRGTYTFTLRARDSAGNQAEHTATIAIEAPPLTISTSTLPTGLIGVPYSGKIEASGTPPYLFRVTGGSLPDGLGLASHGEFIGTPRNSGAFQFSISVTDASTATAQASFRLEIQNNPLTLDVTSLPKGYAGLDYFNRLAARGGAGNIRFSARSPLPTGMSLSADGRIAGRPESPGQYLLQIRATDLAQQIADANISWIVDAAPTRLTILESTAPGFTYGLNSQMRFAAVAGSPPYRWRVVQGSFPSGLRLDPTTGQVTGRPLVWGPADVTLGVTDSSGAEARLRIEFAVRSPIQPPRVILGGRIDYSFAPLFPPGTSFAVDPAIPGRLPEGVSLSRDGVLSGTATATGFHTFGLLLLSSGGEYTSASAFLAVEPVFPQPLPGATVGVPYAIALDPGTDPPRIVSGILPPGLGVNAAGRVEGTPTLPGSYAFTARIGPENRHHMIHVLPEGAPTLAALANAANYGTGPIAPVTLLTAFGQGIGPPTLAALALDERATVKRELEGARILFDGVPAPLIYASANQSSAISPDFPPLSYVQVVAEYNGIQSAPLFRLGFRRGIAAFTQDGSGRGAVAALNQDGSLNSRQRPARRNEVVTLYLTGCGNTVPPGIPGDIATSALRLSDGARVSIGGVNGEVLYAGSAPGIVVGVCQINVRVAASTASGLQELGIVIGNDSGASSQMLWIE